MEARYAVLALQKLADAVRSTRSLGFDAEKVDLIVTLGGDGTILHAAKLFKVGAVPPVLSFSMGTLGFLLPFRQSSQFPWGTSSDELPNT